jgi:hypothetical protein
VKLTLRRRLSAITAAETSPDVDVWMRFTTPGGNPASFRVCTKSAAVRGVSRADFITTVQPAARAAPALRADMSMGKFQGVTRKLGPTG